MARRRTTAIAGLLRFVVYMKEKVIRLENTIYGYKLRSYDTHLHVPRAAVRLDNLATCDSMKMRR